MGSCQSKTRSHPKTISPTGTQGTRLIPDLRFRVLVIGRANAGKTSILQRVCDTTESPTIYREGEEVRSTNFVYKSGLTADQVKLNPSMDVSDTSIPLHLPLNAVSARRAHHR
jgi:GTPase SAR1 family protein